MKIDSQGEQWRSWILENLGRYCLPSAILADMTRDGWDVSDAISAIDEGLALLGRSCDWHIDLPSPATSAGSFLLLRPRLQMLSGVLNRQECSDLIELALGRDRVPAEVLGGDDSRPVQHEGRSNSTIFFAPRENPLIAQIEDRLSEITHWPVSHAEGIQIQFYAEGQRYSPHYDWFDPTAPGGAGALSQAGQRLATTIIALQQAHSGGATRFPGLGISLRPSVGDAVFFHNVDPSGSPDKATLHAGESVERGVKITATYWQRALRCH